MTLEGIIHIRAASSLHRQQALRVGPRHLRSDLPQEEGHRCAAVRRQGVEMHRLYHKLRGEVPAGPEPPKHRKVLRLVQNAQRKRAEHRDGVGGRQLPFPIYTLH